MVKPGRLKLQRSRNIRIGGGQLCRNLHENWTLSRQGGWVVRPHFIRINILLLSVIIERCVFQDSTV
jgi:hypothetical protein